MQMSAVRIKFLMHIKSFSMSKNFSEFEFGLNFLDLIE